jgi:hypothetical protein
MNDVRKLISDEMDRINLESEQGELVSKAQIERVLSEQASYAEICFVKDQIPLEQKRLTELQRRANLMKAINALI